MDTSGVRSVSAVLADYAEQFGEFFPWPFGVGGLEEAEEIASECMERGEPYEFEYDPDALY